MDAKTLFRNGLLVLAVVATVANTALAQRPYGANRGTSDGRNVAGQFDYYALVMSWSPSYCQGLGGEGDSQQCDRTDGKRYSFVLHGLWPQYAPKGWPQDCPMRGRPFVPRPLINSMLDIMPSDKLVIHEYRKHGTCSGLQPGPYFGLARQLFAQVKIPEDYRNPFETKFVSPGELVADFMKFNPWLRPDMIGVDCGGPGNRLSEIRICFSKDGHPTSCSHNEDQRRLCRADKMSLPPVRTTNPDAPAKNTAPTVPHPRVIPNARNI
jgi:ribonuclease T2